MRKRLLRIGSFAVMVICLGMGCNFFLVHFSGDAKATPEEALPTDAKYEWIEGPKSEKEQTYFFLTSDGHFGTEILTKNVKGWSSSNGISSPLPMSLEDNEIQGVSSDSNLLFGLIKPNGEVKVTVNTQTTKRVPLSSISAEMTKVYNVAGYEIWYIDLAQLKNQKNYLIQVFDEYDSLLNELSI